MGRRGFRRAVLVQCERCCATGTGYTNSQGNVVAVNLAAEQRRGGFFHKACGGVIRAYDVDV